MKEKDIVKGVLYVNWTNQASPLKDSEVIDTIKKEWGVVADGTQTKQFNICNELVYAGIQILCMRGEIVADKVYFMVEGKPIERRLKPFGSSKLPIASPDSSKLPELFSTWMYEVMGF